MNKLKLTIPMFFIWVFVASIAQANPFFKYADTNCDGTGSTDANVNGSSTSVDFCIEPGENENGLEVERMIIFIKDQGSFDSGDYGNGITLTNGIEVGIYNEAGTVQKQDLLGGEVIKINPDWSKVCFDTNHSSYGSGEETLAVRWTFSKAGGKLAVGKGETFRIRIRDNLTGLLEHKFQLQGVAK